MKAFFEQRSRCGPAAERHGPALPDVGPHRAAARAGREALALALDPGATLVGAPGEPRVAAATDDLRDSHGCLLEAGGRVEVMLAAGRVPGPYRLGLLDLHGHVPGRRAPRARRAVLWLDAHGDFNTPETTPSEFLGGMCLAAACGRWDAGFEPSLEPARVLMCGVRDLDAGERVLVETAGVGHGAAVGGRPVPAWASRVYVHLDLDVLDPSVLPAQFAVPNGLSETGLRTLLSERRRRRADDRRRGGHRLRGVRPKRTSAKRGESTALVGSMWGAAAHERRAETNPRKLKADARRERPGRLPPEAAFDRVTQLVAETLRDARGAVHPHHERRQVFKSSVGVGREFA